MKILGFSKRGMSKRKMQQAIDAEVKSFEDELRAKGIKFSIPVNDRKGKIYTTGDYDEQF